MSLTMPYVQVKQKHQVTIPYELRQKLDLHEGDMLEAKIFQGMLVLIPKIIVSKDTQLDDKAEQEKRMLKAYEMLAQKRANPPSHENLENRIESMQDQAEKAGFTQDKLDQIIHEK
jgi:AbrB family looped-hinge helix DNA binding protein